MKYINSIFERLKICWLILTTHTYYVFFVSKPNDENINGRPVGCYIENPSKFVADTIISYLENDKESNI